MIKQLKKTKEEETSALPAKSFCSHFFWAYGCRGNSRDFFLINFPSLMEFKGKNQLPDFVGDFHFDILFIALIICQKNTCQFFWGWQIQVATRRV